MNIWKGWRSSLFFDGVCVVDRFIMIEGEGSFACLLVE